MSKLDKILAELRTPNFVDHYLYTVEGPDGKFLDVCGGTLARRIEEAVAEIETTTDAARMSEALDRISAKIAPILAHAEPHWAWELSSVYALASAINDIIKEARSDNHETVLRQM